MKYAFRFGGPILIIAAIIFYFELTKFEESGGTYETHILIVWLYEALGKWGVVIAFLTGSAVYFFIAIKHFMFKKKGQVVDGKNPNGKPNIWF